MSEEQSLKSPFDDDDDDTASLLAEMTVAPKPKPQQKPAASIEKVAEKVATKSGFTQRKKTKPKMRRSANFYTGRSETIGLRGRAQDKELLEKICDSQEWVKGQALQYALEALQEKIADSESEFWETRNFHGVE